MTATWTASSTVRRGRRERIAAVPFLSAEATSTRVAWSAGASAHATHAMTASAVAKTSTSTSVPMSNGAG